MNAQDVNSCPTDYWFGECDKDTAALHEAFLEELKAHSGQEEFVDILIGFLFQRIGNLMAVTRLQAEQINLLQQAVAHGKPLASQRDVS